MMAVAGTVRRLAVNLIMRADPLNQAVARILNQPARRSTTSFFENYAGDTPWPQRWF
jgi:hypothetical protein